MVAGLSIGVKTLLSIGLVHTANWLIKSSLYYGKPITGNNLVS